MSSEPVGPQDIEVKKEDQVKINAFSRLNAEFGELEEEIKELKDELRTLTDAEEEVQCCLEADGLLFKFGEVFCQVDDMDASEKIEVLKNKCQDRLSEATDRAESVKTQLDDQKSELYAKFGKSINLEA